MRSPSQMVNRFVRVDLSLPDDVLRADFDEFLAAERRSLAQIGGEQPYREAARLKLKAPMSFEPWRRSAFSSFSRAWTAGNGHLDAIEALTQCERSPA